jgi:hypothetical protein
MHAWVWLWHGGKVWSWPVTRQAAGDQLVITWRSNTMSHTSTFERPLTMRVNCHLHRLWQHCYVTYWGESVRDDTDSVTWFTWSFQSIHPTSILDTSRFDWPCSFLMHITEIHDQFDTVLILDFGSQVCVRFLALLKLIFISVVQPPDNTKM